MPVSLGLFSLMYQHLYYSVILVNCDFLMEHCRNDLAIRYDQLISISIEVALSLPRVRNQNRI